MNDELVNSTILFSSNHEKDSYNERMMELLDTREVCFKSIFICSHPDKEDFRQYFDRIPNILRLKIGAKVIITKNMQLKDQGINIVNGDSGRIINFFTGSVIVKLDRFPELQGIEFEYATWEAYDPQFPGTGVVVAKMMQLPLILGWAVTIHKSQGLTLDSVCISFETIFLPGQAYVALSRARTLKGVFVHNFSPFKITACSEVSKFYKRILPEIQRPSAISSVARKQVYRGHGNATIDISKYEIASVINTLITTIQSAKSELSDNQIRDFLEDLDEQFWRVTLEVKPLREIGKRKTPHVAKPSVAHNFRNTARAPLSNIGVESFLSVAKNIPAPRVVDKTIPKIEHEKTQNKGRPKFSSKNRILITGR
jgi:hypothetical protein